MGEEEIMQGGEYTAASNHLLGYFHSGKQNERKAALTFGEQRLISLGRYQRAETEDDGCASDGPSLARSGRGTNISVL